MGELDFDKAQPQAASIGHARLGYEATLSILTEVRCWEKELQRCAGQGDTRPPDFGTRAAAMLAIDVEWMLENTGLELPDSPVHFELLCACLDKLREAVYVPELNRALARVRDAVVLLSAYWSAPPVVAFGFAPSPRWQKDNLDRAAALLSAMKPAQASGDTPRGCLVEIGGPRPRGGALVRFNGTETEVGPGILKTLRSWAGGRPAKLSGSVETKLRSLLAEHAPSVELRRGGKAAGRSGNEFPQPAGLSIRFRETP